MLVALAAGASSTAQGAAGWEGPYYVINRPINPAANEIVHACLIGKPGPNQGKVLLITGFGDRWIWDPAAPTSVSGDSICDNFPDDQFCGCHSFDGDGVLIGQGGTRYMGCEQPRWSWIYDPALQCWNGSYPLLSYTNAPANYGYYYAGSAVMHNGRVISVGGGSTPRDPNPPCSDPPEVFSNGWQVFDKNQLRWQGAPQVADPDLLLPGVPSPYGFTYYPELALLSSGHLFAYNGWFTALMNVNLVNWPVANAPWTVHPSQIIGPNGPRNLSYPNAILRPLMAGVNLNEVMIIGGSDFNDPDVPPTPTNPGGRPALNEVWQIQSPQNAGSTWLMNGTRFPNMTYARKYANTVMLPDGTLFEVGGATYDFYPYTGPGTERVAQPVYVPEILDLMAANPTWQPAVPHISPRLYHSFAILLRDGRVLVGGGYRGWDQSWPNWQPFAQVHSDLEVYNPAYIADTLPRPQILVGSSLTIAYGSSFELKLIRPGSSNPAGEIGSVSLIRCGTVTHHYGWDQRYVDLQFSVSPSSPANKINVTAPPAVLGTTNQSFVAPPGWYLLFVTTAPQFTNGVKVPSVGVFALLQ